MTRSPVPRKGEGKPLAVDLCCGLGGWTEGLLAAGYDVIGFDIEKHEYDGERYPAQLVIQDVLTLHGSQFRTADLIVASPPCQFFSYCAMPWTKAKERAARTRADPVLLDKELAIFRACFRLQREACAAAGRFIPLVVENVRGAVPWVGRESAAFGSYLIWGDAPALMPAPVKARKVPGFRFDGNGGSFQTASVEGIKRPGIKFSEEGFNCTMARELAPRLPRGAIKLSAEDRRQHLSSARKAASAKIAKIPLALSFWIGRAWLPLENADAA